MPDTFSAIEWLQSLASAGGLSLTKHALIPGMSESTEYAQMVKAIAYWLSALRTGGWVPAPSSAPTTGTAPTGGTVAAGTYQVVTAYVSATGESVGSPQGSQLTSGATSTLTVNSPPAMTNATGWYAYVSQAGGQTLTRQQAAGSPTAIGTNLTLSAPPTSSGANPLVTDSSAGFQYGTFALDAYNHLTKRLSYYGNPAQTMFYAGDR